MSSLVVLTSIVALKLSFIYTCVFVVIQYYLKQQQQHLFVSKMLNKMEVPNTTMSVSLSFDILFISYTENNKYKYFIHEVFSSSNYVLNTGQDF